MSRGLSRRKFLQRSAAAAGVAAMASVSRGPWVLAQPSPGEKLRVAVIGAARGGQGRLQRRLRARRAVRRHG